MFAVIKFSIRLDIENRNLFSWESSSKDICFQFIVSPKCRNFVDFLHGLDENCVDSTGIQINTYKFINNRKK